MWGSLRLAPIKERYLVYPWAYYYLGIHRILHTLAWQIIHNLGNFVFEYLSKLKSDNTLDYYYDIGSAVPSVQLLQNLL